MHSFSGLARTLSMSRINTTKRKCIKKGHYTVFIDRRLQKQDTMMMNQPMEY